MVAKTFVVGIDCATDLKKVGAAFAIADGGRPSVETLKNVSAEAVASRLRQALTAGQRVLIAFDAPLGWPAALGTALAGHRAGAGLAPDPNLLFRRATDRWVKSTIGQQPLDVGADRIARTAHAALKLLDELRRLSGAQLPLAWSRDFSEEAACIEVYPAATLRAWALPHNGYKGDQQASRDQRQRIVEELQPLLDFPPPCRGALIESDHALDAAVCVLAASDFLTGRAPEPEDSTLARKEGWIWVRPPRDRKKENLDRVYSREPSALDPVLEKLQAISLPRESGDLARLVRRAAAVRPGL